MKKKLIKATTIIVAICSIPLAGCTGKETGTTDESTVSGYVDLA